MDSTKLLHDIKSLANKFEMIGDEISSLDLENKTPVYQDLVAVLKESHQLLEKLQHSEKKL